MTTSTSFNVEKSGMRHRKGDDEIDHQYSKLDTSIADDKKSSMMMRDDRSLIKNPRKLEAVLGPILLTIGALLTRIYGISRSKIVTWDEAHFGKFGSYYLKREYYFDVHPPLGKMLVGLSGYLAGYNGSFSFDSGATYPEYLDFTKMRVFNSLFNVGCVPLAYLTAKELGLSLPAVWLVSFMMLFELSYICLGKFILLDSMLVFFTTLTIFCWAKFHNTQRKPFSAQWLGWMLATGISIGLVSSVKMVGLFAMSVVGVYTVVDLWIRLGDTKMPYKTYAAHWLARIACLIVAPLLVFMLSYKIHFVILNHTGPGDSNMSSLFQANLIGSEVGGGPGNLAFGSRFTLKNQGLNGGLLHSHVQTFPEGSEQQQVTTYHHKDGNNDWQIQHLHGEELYSDTEPIRYVKNGDIVRFFHVATGRNLHSHSIQAPLTKSKWEVSSYGNATVGDTKDHWQIEIVENIGSEDKSIVHPLSSSIRLKHVDLGCYLSGEGNNLPPWGFRQGEVTCAPKASKRDKRTWWNIESHWNDRLETGDKRNLPKSSFLRDFVQLNFAQMASNNALVPDPDKKDDLASRAWEWPTLHVGLRLCGWGTTNMRYFLLGHPSTTWLTSVGVIVFVLMTGIYILRWQRQYRDFTSKQLEHYAVAGIIPFFGWVFHYLPFIVMARVTYVHHYLPALYFAVLVFNFLLDHATLHWTPRSVRMIVYLSLYALTAGLFYHFSPIAFGMTGDLEQYKYLNWLKTWKI